MRALEDDLFPSTPGKVKIERAGGTMNRQLHRCFASTSTMFLWALFLVAMTASYLSFQSFVDTSSKYFAASSPSSSTSSPSRTCSTWRPRPACATPWRIRPRTCTPTWRGSSPSWRRARTPTRSRPSSGPPPPRSTASTTRCPSPSPTARTSRRRSTRPPRRPARRSPTRTTTSTGSPSPACASSRCTGPGGGRTWPTSPSPATSCRGSPSRCTGGRTTWTSPATSPTSTTSSRAAWGRWTRPAGARAPAARSAGRRRTGSSTWATRPR
uniref:Uncharacterized protein n=1 Tax=Aegilops tauschii subsp. strangulata TaxID=200361 RepID=A0A453PV44_AEGTS